jgi:hypothetical protein
VNSLARLPDLRVAAYKLNKTEGARIDVRTIGGQMHVGTMLEGSVTKAGTRVRIRVKLTKLPDGYTLWSESYDRTLDDIFAVQDDIARSVAAALQVTLLARSRRPVLETLKPTTWCCRLSICAAKEGAMRMRGLSNCSRGRARWTPATPACSPK